ncbi:U-box domain-containing protein 33-like isoform X2 [Rhodamnia argentea]|uniref:RING-type E3 ubiquitin transferase n=1 Tax=Rhodamnia argentea TaxID=178133 RepID=A0ABM3HKF8_9MYRT|nr:U-box domain-containing protein 33-like isoform X2 [Rhodamnia argentea]
MELLRPCHPHHGLAGDPLSRFPSPESFGLGFDLSTSSAHSSEMAAGGEKVYVAVGKSVEKAIGLIQWSVERFSGVEICVVHVHQPSPVIPTLLGKLPASQASIEVVSAYRREEKEQTRKLLRHYLTFCCTSKSFQPCTVFSSLNCKMCCNYILPLVKASVLSTEAEQVQKGIVEMVVKYGIRRLVMGAVPENCMKVKKSSSKANYAAKHAPAFCEISFVNKGKRIWTRDAFEGPIPLDSLSKPQTSAGASMRLPLSAIRDSCSKVTGWLQDESVSPRVALTGSPNRYLPQHSSSLFSSTSASSCSGRTYSERRVSLDSDMKVNEEILHSHFTETWMQVEAIKKEALQELMTRKKLEAEAVEVISKVKVIESAYAHEAKLRNEAEDALRTAVQKQEKLLEEREEIVRKLQKTMRNVALLDSRAQEASRRRDEAAGELHVIQASIATLRQEKQQIQRHKAEAVSWLERWKGHRRAGAARCTGFFGGLNEDIPGFAEFSLSEVQSATCDFSESFKIGQSGHGCVYKGEMLGRTVAIKKLHSHNMQGQFEFQREVQVLSKLQHPRLVTLLGACPEAWSLVYEYLPNGSLQDCLFRKGNSSPLIWDARVRIIAEISSALCFLHSSKPERIVHGDLKPENVLLDSDLSCKICDFGISRLVAEDTLRCPSFRRITEPKRAFPYTDPEFYRDGNLTPKSDVYSFGLIILQLLTGRPPTGLVSEVRKAVSFNKLELVLDQSAGQWPTFVAQRLVDLGLQCCDSNGRNRPKLTPTFVRELEQLHISEERTVPSFFLCPILQEIMHDPQIAADGFTYEGEALLEWLESGHDTSPMTNLKLSHLHLTPNHALRSAIQDWLCNP